MESLKKVDMESVHLESPEEFDANSQASKESYVPHEEIEVKPHFFEVLGKIPSLSKLSLDVSSDEITEKSYQSSTETEIGPKLNEQEERVILEEHPSVSSGTFLVSKTEAQEISAEHEHFDDEQESDDEDLLQLPEIKYDSLKRHSTKTLPDDDLDLWGMLETKKRLRITEMCDPEAFERMETERKNREATTQFMKDLIAQIVEKCGHIDLNRILRSNLNKVNLVNELESELYTLEVEQKACFFLNRKAVEYFRRRKTFRSITEDPPDTIAQFMNKYKEAVNALDLLLGREEETQNLINFKLAELEGQVFDLGKLASASIQQFETLVRETLCRESYEKIPLIVNNLLRKMAVQREEISEVRLTLIRRQHALAKLLERSNKIENIGRGLRLTDYQHIQTDTIALNKKIEERSIELSKLRSRYNADLHIMAHMKERKQTLLNNLVIEELALNALVDEKNKYREKLCKLKFTRNQRHREIHEHSFQGGLIDKPALMIDYDETMTRIGNLRARLGRNKQKLNTIQKRILAIER